MKPAGCVERIKREVLAGHPRDETRAISSEQKDEGTAGNEETGPVQSRGAKLNNKLTRQCNIKWEKPQQLTFAGR